MPLTKVLKVFYAFDFPNGKLVRLPQTSTMTGRNYSRAKESFILAQKDITRSWKLQAATFGVE